MQKLLIICGPTATGKTALAILLARKFDGELVSADSRQVYQGLDILTGKDIPASFRRQTSALAFNNRPIGYYGDGTKIWLTDVFELEDVSNVAEYSRASEIVLGDIFARGRLPIAVGGTGLYLKALTEELSTVHLAPDSKLRKKLENAPPEALQRILEKTAKDRWESMNQSDRRNPRRLIRAIEVAQRQKSEEGAPARGKRPYDVLWIGLAAPREILDDQIRQRITKRMSQGVVPEVKAILKRIPAKNFPAASVLGLPLIRAFLSGRLSEEELVARWLTAERQYAKRQLTWFHKNPSIRWFEITKRTFPEDVVAYVEAWYTTSSYGNES